MFIALSNREKWHGTIEEEKPQEQSIINSLFDCSTVYIFF
jgi:hypothetical protein